MGVLLTQMRDPIISLSMFCLGHTDHQHIGAMMVHNMAELCYSDHWGRGPADLPAPIVTAARRGWRIHISPRIVVDRHYLVPYHSQLGVM